MNLLKGTGVALVTPFDRNNTVDFDALGRVVDHCIKGGLDYLVVLGTTGESVTLSATEKRQIIKAVADQNAGRVPLVVGIGGNNTAQIVEDLQEYNLSAYQAVLSVSPYYNRPSQEGIYRHFKKLAAVSPLPLIIYNVPGRTASNILPQTVIRLAMDCPNIIGVKEASGDMTQVEKLINTAPSDFLVISGDDITALPTVLAGGVGVISVLAQAVPTEFKSMIENGLAGRDQTATAIHQKLVKGMELIFEEGNPAGVKAMLEHLEIINSEVRLPLVQASDDLKSRIGLFMNKLVQMPA